MHEPHAEDNAKRVAFLPWNPAASSPDTNSALASCHGRKPRPPTALQSPYQLHARPSARGAQGCLREHSNVRASRTFKDDDNRPRSLRSNKRSLERAPRKWRATIIRTHSVSSITRPTRRHLHQVSSLIVSLRRRPF